ncbi:MAG TPA: hypothetical protein VGN54_03135 [Mycobacteriales bacterium]|jgi:hypothetical protein|nr:hypothetical protein [Mycobacteriales bacterium]
MLPDDAVARRTSTGTTSAGTTTRQSLAGLLRACDQQAFVVLGRRAQREQARAAVAARRALRGTDALRSGWRSAARPGTPARGRTTVAAVPTPPAG